MASEKLHVAQKVFAYTAIKYYATLAAKKDPQKHIVHEGQFLTKSEVLKQPWPVNDKIDTEPKVTL